MINPWCQFVCTGSFIFDQTSQTCVCPAPLVLDATSNQCAPAPAPTGCAITTLAPANGSLSCNWKSGVDTWKCNYGGPGFCTNTVGYPTVTPAPSYSSTTATVGNSCASTDPHTVKNVVSACFTARTNVDTPSGSKKINDLQIGDLVSSYDSKSHKIVPGIITQVFHHSKRRYWILNTNSATSLEVTPNHPIYDSLRDIYLPVSEANLETQLLIKEENFLNQASIKKIADYNLVDDVYNIEVEPEHNYFANGILVHNKLPGPGLATSTRQDDTLTSCNVVCNAGFVLDVPSNTCIGAGTPTPAPPIGSLTVSPVTDGNFGNIVISSLAGFIIPPGITKDFTFTNNTAGDVSGCNFISLSPDFTLITSNCNPIISKGGSCTATVRGLPQTLGVKANVPFTLKCSGGETATAILNETGVDWPKFTFAPDSNTFSPSSPSQITVTVTNGASSLSANGCVISFTQNASSFVMSNNNSCTTGKFSSSGSCTVDIGPAPSSLPIPPNTPDITTQLQVKCIGSDDPNYSGAKLINALAILAQSSKSNDYKISSINSNCPPGYSHFTDSLGTTSCKPILPSTEYSTDPNGYPVCGSNRLPVSYDAARIISSSASNSTPVYSGTVNYNSDNYSYATTSAGGLPTYIYATSNHCACSSKNTYVLPAALAGSAPQPLNKLFLSDDYDTVSKLDGSAATPVSEVVFPSAGTNTNGYLDPNYTCGCPNVNETASAMAASPATSLTGTICKPAFASAYRVLIPYSPGSQASSVLPGLNAHPALQTIDLPTAAQSFPSIPISTMPSPSYTPYPRKIWTCSAPFELDPSTKQCIFVTAHHSCDDGTNSGIPSVVSSGLNVAGVSNPTAAQKFNNAVNKRLACCLNTFDPADPNAILKYDCVDNSQTPYPNFDALWQSSTENVPNAIILTNANGEPVTGFYSLNGVRCPNCSEFAGAIKSSTVNPYLISSQQNLTANATSITGGPGSGYGANKSSLQTAIDYTHSVTYKQPNWVAQGQDPKWKAYLQNKIVPNTAELMRTYPILVRAAIKTVCPSAIPGQLPAANSTFPALSSPIKMIETFNDGATPNVVRCMGASRVTAHLQITQITTITGAPNAKTYETDISLNGGRELQVNVKDLINNKVGTLCPLGMIFKSDSNSTNGNCFYP